MKVKYADIEVGLDLEREPGNADSGDLDTDLADLIAAVGEAAAERGTAVVLFIDQLQYVPKDQLAYLTMALHGANQAQLPITMVAAGLPQLLGRAGRAKSYSERLFELDEIDRLNLAEARLALCLPAEREGAAFTEDAVQAIFDQTKGYPYFLQKWGKHSLNVADASPIDVNDALRATDEPLAELVASFFRVRFDRLTRTAKTYMASMATLGPGPHRSGAIAARLGKRVTTVAPVGNALIAKGLLYSPGHGDTAFTVPLFDAFMKRTTPGGG